jgi:plastocyanin
MHDGMWGATARRTATALAILTILLCAMSCGSQPPTQPSPGPQPTTPTVMVESSGLNPPQITIGVGETVSFMNHDSVAYAVTAGTGPAQPGCAEIGAVGVLAPFEIRATAPFSTAKTCDYHVPRGSAQAFTGRIIVR